MPMSQVYDAAFDYLKDRRNRHEYIYKAAITTENSARRSQPKHSVDDD